MYPWRALPGTQRLAAILVLTGALAGGVRLLAGSDHQDTPLVELNPRMDLTDVYAFPGSAPGRIVLVMNTSGFLSPGQTGSAAFDPNILYQFKVDNDGDYVEDKVIQVTFDGNTTSQTVHVRGPFTPTVTGAMMNVIDFGASDLSGGFNTNLGSASGIQAFAGPRDDSFFLDLEAAFCILPDRRPSTGALSQPCALAGGAAFRNPGVNYIEGFNVLSIVVELPSSMLENGAPGKLNIWGTISR
ncbi:MAG TPA: DUF4331 family protein [Gemmatimonadales bacterium]|nr:DUF4331 family protein [Gemmatimonadales bacterium]